MGEFLVFIEQHQPRILLFLCFMGLVYFRLAVKRYREIQRTFFGLERERARARYIQSAWMTGMVLASMILVFALGTFLGPAVPMAARPTVLPTVFLLGTPVMSAVEEPAEPAISPVPGEETPSGCDNPNATIYSPRDGESIGGLVEIRGAADIDGFAFYKVEVRDQSPGAVWRAIGAGTDPVCEQGCKVRDELARWDASLVTPGAYSFRLTVLDAAGNAPLPCEITVNVSGSE